MVRRSIKGLNVDLLDGTPPGGNLFRLQETLTGKNNMCQMEKGSSMCMCQGLTSPGSERVSCTPVMLLTAKGEAEGKQRGRKGTGRG